MADCGSLQSPAARYINPISSIFFNCPKLFTGAAPESQLQMSPTSILDSIPFSGFKNPLSSESITPKSTPEPDHKRSIWTNLESNSNKVGLSILESLEYDSQSQKQYKADTRMVLFGSQLKIQIPLQPSGDYGIKTRACHHHHPSVPHKSPKEAEMIKNVKSCSVFSGCLYPVDMELSEDYTCIISHGPNPKTTHIYDNCIVESCCGVTHSFAASRTQTVPHRLPEDFLNRCFTCHKDLSFGEDIYMYKGEKAFCSSECRYEEMRLDEENLDLN